MNSYQPTEDLQKIQAAAFYLKARINELKNSLILYDPDQIVNVPFNEFRKDVKKSLQFFPEVNKWMNSFHTDFIQYTRDQVYNELNRELERIGSELSSLTDVPPKPKRTRHYKSKQAYEQAQAEISALAAKVLAPMTSREKWRFVQSRMRIKIAREKAAIAN